MELKVTQQLNEHRTHVEQQINKLILENQEFTMKIRAETKEVIREEMETVQAELKESLEKSDQVFRQHQVVVAQEIKTLNNKVNNNNKKNGQQIEELTELYENTCTSIDGQLTQIREDVRTRLMQMERSPMPYRMMTEHIKNVTFNGEGEYPMEFVKELDEIHREYYMSEGVNWVSRHLEGEAAIWWKLIKNNIKTFQEFQEACIAKYWNQMVQEGVRDRLDFGRYRPESGLSMVQYMERCILQNQQLIPPISDQHLIRKLARHYHHDIAVACIKGG